MNTIVILTHQRPECLQLCLESLTQARGIRHYRIYIATNEDCHPDIVGVCHKVIGWLNPEIDIRPAGWLIDQSNAEAFKAGADRSDDYFIEVAEDEEVSRDCLETLEYAAKSFRTDKTFGIASAFSVSPFRARPDCDNLIAKHAGLTTQATLIFNEPFNRLLRPLLTPEYYGNEYGVVGGLMTHKADFLAKHFAEFPQLGAGLDGIIEKLMARHGMHSFTPLVPRAHQIGFYGTHMRTNEGVYNSVLTGDTEHKARQLRAYIDSGRIKGLFGDWAVEYHSIKPDHSWATLELITDQTA